jgi:hypothetical protein
MQSTSRSARQWNILVLLIVGLAIAVFAWGLRYKLSLYHSAPQPTHRVVLAKLLSNRERPADTVVQIERATTPDIVVILSAIVVLTAVFALDSKLQSQWLFRYASGLPVHTRDPRALRRIESRPPPVNIY